MEIKGSDKPFAVIGQVPPNRLDRRLDGRKTSP